ncbi:hypothetical protein E3P91_02216 [Wallemia ichthyophaga]|nr:hypothetical protein E3P91_02216 [Wallemia ichthyophaga]
MITMSNTSPATTVFNIQPFKRATWKLTTSASSGLTAPSINSKDYNLWEPDNFSKHADGSSRGDEFEEAFDNIALEQQREIMEKTQQQQQVQMQLERQQIKQKQQQRELQQRDQVQQQQKEQQHQQQEEKSDNDQREHLKKAREIPLHLRVTQEQEQENTSSQKQTETQTKAKPQPQIHPQTHPQTPHIGTSRIPPHKPNEQKRQPIACFNCRQRRLKCDGENPCSPCVRRGVAESCAFAQQVRRRGPGRKKLAQLASLGDVNAANALGIKPGEWVRDPELFPPSPKRKRND